MIAIPSVDLSDASIGPRQRNSNPQHAGIRSARALADFGFSRLHLEDFRNRPQNDVNLPAVEEIVRDTDALIQVVGPSSGTEIDRLFRTGAEYIVVGDRSIDEPEWLERLARLYPEAIVVRTAVHDRRVVRQGWVRTVPVDVLDLVEALSDLPLAGILVGGLDLQGSSRHGDLAMVEDLAERSRSPILVSGKIETADDLRALEYRGAAAAVMRAGSLLSGALDPHAIAIEFGS
jgi:phosphoribosylformimino-5-aminoimidazole carboxamide ribonucleotide (ProFAR) isomerase